MTKHKALRFAAVYLALLTAATSVRAQTFDIEELPVLQEKDYPSKTSSSIAINERGHILGSRVVESLSPLDGIYLWDGQRDINVGNFFELAFNDLDQVIGSGFVGEQAVGVFWDGGSVTTLGFRPAAFNNLGQVAGATEDGLVLWTAETGTRILGTLPGGGSINPFDIVMNERGHVTGLARVLRDGQIEQRAFIWSEESGLVELDRASDVRAMNDHDQIVGMFDRVPFRLDVTIDADGDVTWDRTDLPTVSQFSLVTDINNAGQAVGWNSNRTVVWDTDGTPIVNDVFVSGSTPVINDSGHVAFWGSVGERGFFWDPHSGVTVQLPTLVGGATRTVAMNEFDEIAGTSRMPDLSLRAVVWRPTGPIPESSVEILLLKELLRTLWGDGLIFDGDAVSLLAKLCAADSQLRAGHVTGAIGVLISAQNQIDQLIRNDFISQDAGNELIAAINVIIDML